MLPTVLCLVPSHSQAEQVVARLQGAGVPVAAVAVLVLPADPDVAPAPIQGLAYQGAAEAAETPRSAAATGAAAGAAAGTATMSIVGMTPLLMIAPLVVGAGAALGAATAAAASGLTDYGIPQALVEHYQQRLAAGDLIVAVRTEEEDQLERAHAVFTEAGGRDIELFRLTKKLD